MNKPPFRVLVTGSRGFIGKNLLVRLEETKNVEILTYNRDDNSKSLFNKITSADFIYHLAGTNRPEHLDDFNIINCGLTNTVCEFIEQSGRKIPLLLASSTQVDKNNLYGKSKLAAEKNATDFAKRTNNPVIIYRLPGIFGKWCKPNYNSVVATFCYNIAHDLPIKIDDSSTILRLAYIDDIIDKFIIDLRVNLTRLTHGKIDNIYEISLGDLADLIKSFGRDRKNLMVKQVGKGITRALYSTFISYLPIEKLTYDIPVYQDSRGIFAEIIKTKDSGQISFFTINPGVTRGSHYHHSKTEKFCVVSGKARLRFRMIGSQEIREITVSGDDPKIVDTIPGWIHDISNIGVSETVVIVWANEIFDSNNPDTISKKV